jgi:hypothetical protein
MNSPALVLLVTFVMGVFLLASDGRLLGRGIYRKERKGRKVKRVRTTLFPTKA